MTRRDLTVAAAAIAIVAARPAAQQPGTPVFRGAVEAVELVVRVVDNDGRFVRDLTREDFRVLEDGREQKIDTFELIDIPIEPSHTTMLEGAAIEPDVASNVDAAAGRLYVIVLDDRDLGGEPEYRFRSVTTRAIAREFIEHHVSDADRVAVMSTSGRTDLAQDFTSNRQLLLDTVSRYEAGFGQEPSARGTVNPTTWAFRSVKALANWLAPIQGRRKTIVLITQNMGLGLEDTSLASITDALDEGNDVRDMIVAANRANVGIYILDPVGLPGAPTYGIIPVHLGDNAEYNLSRRMALEQLAESTGGFALTGSNEFIPAMDRIVKESSSYYVLSYSSSNTKRDGKLRKIKVDVARPQLTALTRSGYFADKPKSAAAVKSQSLPPALAKLIQSPLPVSGLPLQVSALALRGRSGKASVTVIVEAQGRDIQFTAQNGRQNGTVSFVMTAADQDAKVRASERTMLTFHLSPEQHAAVVQDGVRFLTQVQLKSGRYQVKVAGLDTGNRNGQGIVLYDFVVPDFGAEALSMSSIAVGAKSASRVPTNAPDNAWRKLLGMTPTTRRTFLTSDELHLYAEVYDKKTQDSIDVTTRVQREWGQVVFSESTVAAASVNANAAVRAVAATVPLKGLEAGRYVLSITADRGGGHQQPVTRRIPFDVRN